jgi:hypothetical protein
VPVGTGVGLWVEITSGWDWALPPHPAHSHRHATPSAVNKHRDVIVEADFTSFLMSVVSGICSRMKN